MRGIASYHHKAAIKTIALILGILALVVALFPLTRPASATTVGSAPADPPSYLPWFTVIASPIPGAYSSVSGAFGAANVYNEGAPYGMPTGTGILATERCSYVCFGAPGLNSHHILAFGNDIVPASPMPSSTSYSHIGAADDCNLQNPPPPPPTPLCPGGIPNKVFGISISFTPNPNSGFYVAVDGVGNFGALNNVYSAHAVIAGVAAGTPAPSPSSGSLVSYTGSGSGDVLLGSHGAGNYVKCDYGETTNAKLTCDQPLVISSGGVRPNGNSGGFAPAVFSLGTATAHPRIVSGSCALSGASGQCTFPNSFSFGGTDYTCSISAQGTNPTSDSYAINSDTQITIYGTALHPMMVFSYICTR